MYNTVNSGYNTVNSPPPAPEMRRSQSWTPQPDPNHSPINSHSGYNGSGAQQQQHSPYGSGQTVRALTNMYTEAANRTPQLDRPPGMQQNPVLIQLCEEIDALKRALSMEQRDKKELDAKVTFSHICVYSMCNPSLSLSRYSYVIQPINYVKQSVH